MADREFLIKESTLSDIASTIRENSYNRDPLKVSEFSQAIWSACSQQYQQGEQSGYWRGKDEGYDQGWDEGWYAAQNDLEIQLNEAYRQGKQDGRNEGEIIGEQFADQKWQQKLQNYNLSFSIYTTLAPGEGWEIIEFEYIAISEDGQTAIQNDSSAGENTMIEYAALENSIIKTNKTYYTQISTIHNLTKIGETSSHYFFRITR